MIAWLKRLFTDQEAEREAEKPGRTFKRLLTGDYFGLQNPEAAEEEKSAAKEEKIRKIRSLELKPVFLRYALKKTSLSDTEPRIVAAHVAFQSEVLDEKWNMVHVTEISFIVPKEEFAEFEAMAGVSLQEDFRDLTEYHGTKRYVGKERRQKPRSSPFDKVS
jgi:hypothetical protein